MRTGIGLSFKNSCEARKPSLLPYGKCFEVKRERVAALECNERVFKG